MEKSVCTTQIQYASSCYFLTPFSTDQRNLGMSMKVERATLDNVKERMAALKRKKEQPQEEYG
jgi:hypothetical protein